MGSFLMLLLIYIAWTNHRILKVVKREKGILGKTVERFITLYKDATRKEAEASGEPVQTSEQ